MKVPSQMHYSLALVLYSLPTFISVIPFRFRGPVTSKPPGYEPRDAVLQTERVRQHSTNPLASILVIAYQESSRLRGGARPRYGRRYASDTQLSSGAPCTDRSWSYLLHIRTDGPCTRRFSSRSRLNFALTVAVSGEQHTREAQSICRLEQ